MKKIFIYMLTFTFFSCQSQNSTKNELRIKKDTIKPKTNIEVHKQFDKYGNLIRVDSTYTSFYSSIKNDSTLEKNIFSTFHKNFKSQFNQPLDSLFFKDFFNESPFKMEDFYTNDFFSNNFIQHQKEIEKIFKKMDSVKNKYYKKQKKSKEI
ncbi:hypothetical protein KCTC32516_02086 [Polaribacter huanghezhanensis]|uniref:hypothetical protein n=1 Tax=Polaribacter huanghezhanensis TaxID=1354726 RepID=UPI002648E6B6|nr:hypothetical protein [Polaribacter huanghezhanensis]WKD86710.1 hypothetical protein KCTC32516_02086 [Polaribacter huanghezhanensis]